MNPLHFMMIRRLGVASLLIWATPFCFAFTALCPSLSGQKSKFSRGPRGVTAPRFPNAVQGSYSTKYSSSPRVVPQVRSSSSSSVPSSDGDNEQLDEAGRDSANDSNKKNVGGGLRKRLSSYFRSSKKDDELTFKQRLAKMGLATVLSYGWISNTNAMILVSMAWYVFCAKSKVSPFFPGQWKPFLGVYAGFYVLSNFLRPFRVALAVAIGPYFDRFVLWIEEKAKVPKAAAIFVTVLLVNLVGTLCLMVGGISLASFLSGVPIFPPKA